MPLERYSNVIIAPDDNNQFFFSLKQILNMRNKILCNCQNLRISLLTVRLGSVDMMSIHRGDMCEIPVYSAMTST